MTISNHSLGTFIHIARVALLFILIANPASSYSLADLSENQAKAALLYNFMKHTQWPNENNFSQFQVDFIGDENFYNEFNKIAKEINVRGKKVVASNSLIFDPKKSRHVLVIASSNNNQLKDLATALIRSGTLLVSDNANDQKIVMINFTHPKKDALSFEVNKSNIVYEGLHISTDVLLHGGTEIEIATLYKEMEFLLGKIKNDVEQNKKTLNLKLAEIDNKNAEILLLKNKTENINQELGLQTAKFNDQQEKLRLLDIELNNVKATLDNSKQLLLDREQLVKALEVEIQRKQDTLDTQQDQINSQQEIVAEKSEEVILQSATISSQRNIIFIAFFLLLIFLLLIINRQKQALSRQRQLVETKAELIKAQSEAIAAYESSIQLKNDFLTAISHEMRTPMNGIIGALQIAKQGDTPDPSMVMDIISKSATDMLTLVDDILTYIEIQSEQVEVKTEPVSTHQFFDLLRQHYSHLCQEKSLTLNWHISNDLPPRIEIDIKKFSKILHKLLDNALKFTEAGAITVIVKYEPAEGKGRLICTIKDTGTGITPEQQEHIFSAFWQSDSGLTRRYEGLGIGLTICQKFIHLLGGTIDIVSVKDSGTVFTVVLNITETQSLSALPTTDIHLENTALVLIVEDNLINQKVLELMLEKLGYECIIANDGIEALAILDHQVPALILMDLQMPRMDGISCVLAIRQRTDTCKDIPVVAISANLMESQQRHCMEAGMNGYLNKPIEMVQLKQTLDQFVHHRNNP